jgi:ATP-dependent helicase/nuclease subunit B
MQLGLLAWIADQGGFPGIDGKVTAFEYWSLAKRQGRIGFVDTPAGRKGGVEAADFAAAAAAQFTDAAGNWLTGSEPFTAKLHPEYAPYGDYDQLMRRDEWYGRGG